MNLEAPLLKPSYDQAIQYSINGIVAIPLPDSSQKFYILQTAGRHAFENPPAEMYFQDASLVLKSKLFQSSPLVVGAQSPKNAIDLREHQFSGIAIFVSEDDQASTFRGVVNNKPVFIDLKLLP